MTVHGSVAYEFSYMNKPVILASKAPHLSRYSFCFQPKNKRDYLNNLLNINKLKKIKYNKKYIIIFYLINFLCSENFGNLLNLKKKLGSEYFSPLIYKYWIKKFSNKKHQYLIERVNKFLISKKPMMWNKKIFKT